MKLLEQIFEIANKNPDLIVLAEREQKFTYRQLFVAVSEISKQIKERTLVNRPILIFGKNDFISLAAMLAANLTGHAYISVDAHTPFERTEMINSAAKPAVVITTVNLSEDFSALFTDRISVNLNTLSLDEKLPELDFSQAVSGNDSNYIIYTSGTTGVPKGVEVSHANLVTFTNWMNNDFNKIENNQILSQALYSFDLSIFSLYPSLTTGGTLVSLSRDETTNFKLLFERLNSIVINTWISTPSFVDICLLDPSFTEKEHPNLVQFIFCGEELTKKTAEKLLTAFPSATIYNTYGPTEATGAISSIKVTEKLLTENDRLPIGFAKPGVELKIMDGEIIIIGDSVAKGYFENPEKTAQAFFAVDGKPAYHTGDAGSLTDEGMLRYQGRIDFQVKFNGFRIELQDIEANIQNLKDIEKAVVLPKSNDQHKVTALIAYLESEKTFADRAEERAFTKQLKAELSKTIMDYMMPTKFIYLKKFPLNQNGKVDRKALAQKERGDN
ncbi:D-alanine--poly(phosphoribitol) ligase subunit 1 [Lactococcus lactis]|uniref:D-alanine--poly(phosphoribitol) ligase subunit DltA n=1 Tax=Lactococcus lactis subsp. cremoris TaxID=1359 RepID=UPI0007DA2108|nr:MULTISPECIES: D-alanine--poly(phosphoribitol) ligase subunit DltA [Lactococcus]AXN65516.1 D-alanine--poly(phosphoribitol) ligase subunit 1 [Lactococcus cremoris]MRM51828.1 D-alanine--poly(phosphoribitol) ligase subunit DltA [Lactococcus cremoris]OAJ97313.1 D-alanine--poly(phosphoribitol) ligase subunit 1 [Lactococcus lactis]